LSQAIKKHPVLAVGNNQKNCPSQETKTKTEELHPNKNTRKRNTRHGKCEPTKTKQNIQKRLPASRNTRHKRCIQIKTRHTQNSLLLKHHPKILGSKHSLRHNTDAEQTPEQTHSPTKLNTRHNPPEDRNHSSQVTVAVSFPG